MIDLAGCFNWRAPASCIHLRSTASYRSARSSTPFHQKMAEKPECKYGANCYRKSKEHLQQFRHPTKRAKEDQSEEESCGKRPKLAEHAGEEELESDIKSDGAESGQSNSDDVEDETKSEEAEEEKGQSSNEDTDVTPPSLDIKEELRLKFKVQMPQDFFDFWDYCKDSNPSDPCAALEADTRLRLGGPYDVMAGRLKQVDGQEEPRYVLHHRYYYDPPEFQTVIIGDEDSQFHLGYYRDEPQKDPVFVAANTAKEGCTITPQGESIFAAVKLYIDKLVVQTKDRSRIASLKKREKSVAEWAKKCNHPLEARTKGMKAREKAVVTRTFHKAGIVVPVDSTGVGYRELPETDASLKKMLKKIVESETEQEKERQSDNLQEIVTYIQFANDECDYGQGYELGIDLFSFGEEHFHSMARMLLSVAYQLLGREEFGEILNAHLKDRQRDDVSQIL